MTESLLQIIRQLQAVSQNGLLYAETEFHKERYEKVRDLALELLKNLSNSSIELIKTTYLDQKGYATPKLDVRAVIVIEDKMLFVKEADDQKWALPGGWVEVGETPAQCIVKEVKEECGIDVCVEKLIGVYDKDLHQEVETSLFQVISLFFVCKPLSSNPNWNTNYETEEIKLFSKDQLPELSLSRINSWQIDRAFKHIENPHLKTDID